MTVIIRQPQVAEKPKKLKKAFKLVVNSLQEGKLKTNILNNLDDYFSELQNILTSESSTARHKETDSFTESERRKSTKTSDGKHATLDDTKVLSDGEHLPYNLYCSKASTISEEHSQHLDQEERCKTYQVYLRCNLLNLENDALLEIAAKCQPTNSDADQSWIERLVVLASCLLGDDNPHKLQKVMELFNGQFALVAEELCDSKKKKCRRLEQFCHMGEKMLKFFHLHYHGMNCVFDARPCYEDLLAGILATYIDAHLLMIHSDSEHSEISCSHMHGLVLRLLGNKVHYGYDIILQLEHVQSTDATFLLPLARCFLQKMEDTTSPKLYTKFVLAARMVLNIWPDETKDLRQGAQNVAAPLTFLAWLRDRDSSLLDHIPENKHFRGVNITRWFLEEVDEGTVQSLLDLLMLEEEKSFYEPVTPSSEETPERLEIQEQTEMENFVIDKAPNIDTANLLRDMMKDAKPTLGGDNDNVEWLYVDLNEVEIDRESESIEAETPDTMDTQDVVYEVYTKNDSQKMDIVERTEKVLQSINTSTVSGESEGNDTDEESSCDLEIDETLDKNRDTVTRKVVITKENKMEDKVQKVAGPSLSVARHSPKPGKQSLQTVEDFTKCDAINNQKAQSSNVLSIVAEEAAREGDGCSKLYSSNGNTSDEDSEDFHKDMMETLMGVQVKESGSGDESDSSGVCVRTRNGTSPAQRLQFASPPLTLNNNSSSFRIDEEPANTDDASVQNAAIVPKADASPSSPAVTGKRRRVDGDDATPFRDNHDNEASRKSRRSTSKSTSVSPRMSRDDGTTSPAKQCASPSISIHEKMPPEEMIPTAAGTPVRSAKMSKLSSSCTVELEKCRQTSPTKSPNASKKISPTKPKQDLASTRDGEISPKSSPSKPSLTKTSPSRRTKYVASQETAGESSPKSLSQSKRRKVPMERDIDHTPIQFGSQRRSLRNSTSKALDNARDVYNFTSDSEVEPSGVQRGNCSPDVKTRRKSTLPLDSTPVKPLDMQMTRILQEEGLKPRRRKTASSAEISADLSKLATADSEENKATAVFSKPSYGSKTYSTRRRSMPVNVATHEKNGSEPIAGAPDQGLPYTALLPGPRRSRRISEMSIDSTDRPVSRSRTRTDSELSVADIDGETLPVHTASGRKISTPERFKGSPKKQTPRKSMSTPTKK